MADIQKDVNVDIRDIPVREIRDNPYQSRTKYNRAAIKRLAKSISLRGLMHPVAVAETKDGYVLISGHRRLRAFRSLHRKTIPAVVKKGVTKKDLALDVYIENAMREDLKPMEKAQAIFRALNTLESVKGDIFNALSLVGAAKQWKKRGFPGYTRGRTKGAEKDVPRCERILALLAMSGNTAISYLRILMLPDSILGKVESAKDDTNIAASRRAQGYITVKQAYELTRVKSVELQKQLYRKIISEGWTYWVLRAVIDELLESGTQALMVSNHGRAGRKGEENYGMDSLAGRCFKLAGHLKHFRQHNLVMVRMQMGKTILRASLKTLRKHCGELMDETDATLEGPLRVKEKRRAEAEQREFDVVLKDQHGGIRFTLPNKVAGDLGVDVGDTVRIRARKVR